MRWSWSVQEPSPSAAEAASTKAGAGGDGPATRPGNQRRRLKPWDQGTWRPRVLKVGYNSTFKWVVFLLASGL